MQDVKIPTSDSWKDALIESLKDPEEAASFIEAILSEKDPEPQLLQTAIQDIIDARVQINTLSISSEIVYEKLKKILSNSKGAEIYTFVELLDTLGFEFSIQVKNELK